MFFIQNSNKDVDKVVQDLIVAVENHNFGVLHVHDLKGTMNKKGVDFKNSCQVLEVCNPHHAAGVLDVDMRICLALPCRIAVYQEKGETKIGTLLPVPLMTVFGDDPAMLKIAQKVEDDILAIIADAV